MRPPCTACPLGSRASALQRLACARVSALATGSRKLPSGPFARPRLHRCAPASPPGSRTRCSPVPASPHMRVWSRAYGRLAPRAFACTALLVPLVRTRPCVRPPCASLPSGLPCTSLPSGPSRAPPR
eukprot:15441687-Alexandrium_andersonii.AAC.1